MKVLVLGDRIVDHYDFCKATRLCPEAPAPVLVVEKQKTTDGGAALVANQLGVLMDSQSVVRCFGSVSEKRRIFADRQLVCRLDRDCQSQLTREIYWSSIRHEFDRHSPEAIVVGDYNKGAMGGLRIDLVDFCKEKSVPLFVDAKSDPTDYTGCYAIFPNENEHNHIQSGDYQHIIRKLGPRGCSVDGRLIPTDEQQVYDVSGAGDVFLAAFVYRWLSIESRTADRLEIAAGYANKVAGLSVRHLGTYVVPLEEINR